LNSRSEASVRQHFKVEMLGLLAPQLSFDPRTVRIAAVLTFRHFRNKERWAVPAKFREIS
jgi:hypothetical protein